jgi:phospho-N-acetylmuramoyl-pentapeptide-transferase
MSLYIYLTVLAAFIISLILGPIVIPILHKLKFGQSIREIGPKWHKNKSGTPTMGGIIFIIGILCAILIFNKNKETVAIFAISLGFGLIGFIDDFIKVVLKRNLGFTAVQKFSAQILVALIGVMYLYNTSIINGEVYLPLFKRIITFESWLYIPFAVLVILSTVNSVNLTDGLDGLATGISIVVSVFLTITAIAFSDANITYFMAAVTGACIAFMIFNVHPAKVFMGDTGALFLGGVISVSALVLKIPFMIVLVGGIFVIEALSVIMQVVSFKLRGKRIFKMSPLHHHFEMTGWRETKVVIVFIFITVILCTIGLIYIYNILPYV